MKTLSDARRLHGLGFAIIWLHPKSKRPIGDGWTTGPRKKWDELSKSFVETNNVGVRLGNASKIEGAFLAAIDCDVKSKDKRHYLEMREALAKLIGERKLPQVSTGRGNGSAHLYCRTSAPFKTFTPYRSTEIVKVHAPSKTASKNERAKLSSKELASGIRLSPAWEISLYSDGRQCVLPPSTHPDSGKEYRWNTPVHSASDLPIVHFKVPDETSLERELKGKTNAKKSKPTEDASQGTFTFEPVKVDLGWLPISDEVRNGILSGLGVVDRSEFLLRATSALHAAGLGQMEILSVLTEPKSYISSCAYEHAQTKNRARAARWLYKYTVRKVLQERAGGAAWDGDPKKSGKNRKLTTEEQAAQTAEIEEGLSWRDDLDKTKEGQIRSCIRNVITILVNEVGPDIIKRNDFAVRDAYGIKPPWGGKKDDALTDDDVAKIRHWLGVKYSFEPGRDILYDSLTTLACKNSFDPVKEMLDKLEPWDGKVRLDTWLRQNFEAEGDSEYLAQVFRKWMVAMVMRVYKPGAKFDWMPIFEGPQGVGKSSFGRLLCGDKYFLDWLPNLSDKDAALALQGVWVVEMGELSQFRKNELETIKAFVTRTVDKVRPPHGRKVLESFRRCVFFGTTNREKYLWDDTGNRRFKPCKVGSLDFEALQRDRIQLFAEAKHLWDAKIETELSLDLDGDAKIYEAKIQTTKMVEDDSTTMREQINKWRINYQTGSWPDFDNNRFRITDLFGGVGPLTTWQITNKNTQFAAKALKKLGFESRKIKGYLFWRTSKKQEMNGAYHHHKKCEFT